MYACMYVYLSVHRSVSISIHSYVRMYIPEGGLVELVAHAAADHGGPHICIDRCIYLYVYMYVSIYASMYVYLSIYRSVSIPIPVYT